MVVSNRVVSIGSLYSGIGGLEVGILAAFVEAGVGARIAWQCEIDPFCTRVLQHHFPDVTRFSDVASVSHPPRVDVLCGGFACQDVSAAGDGKGLGLETRSGFTLHHLLRIIDEIEPSWLVIENVTSGAKRWLPRVVQELRSRGYRPRAVPLGAIDVGAPHRRLRVFVVADREREGLEVERIEQARGQQPPAERGREAGISLAHGHGHGREGVGRSGLFDVEREALGDDVDGRCSPSGEMLPDAERVQLRDEPWGRSRPCGASTRVPGDDGAELADTSESGRTGTDWAERTWTQEQSERRSDPATGDGRAPQPRVGAHAHGLPFDVAGRPFPAGRGEDQKDWEPPRAVQSDVKVPDRPAKLRACGNAVVPQCALVVGRALLALGDCSPTPFPLPLKE